MDGRRDVDALLEVIAERDDCSVCPPAGLPPAGPLPEDLRRLYELCGGLVLFEDADVPWRVVGPRELEPAAARLLAPADALDLALQSPGDPAATTHVFADNGGGSTDEHVLVDLEPSRLGRYYATFWDRFGTVGGMPVVATSVADVLRWLLLTGGEGAGRALASWPTLGDAYE